MPNRVLCLSADPELALLRCTVLRSHGVEVDYPRSKNEAKHLIDTRTYTAVLICHSLSQDSAAGLRDLALGFNPGACVIYIANTAWQVAPVKSDICISGLDGPAALLKAIESCEGPRSLSSR